MSANAKDPARVDAARKAWVTMRGGSYLAPSANKAALTAADAGYVYAIVAPELKRLSRA
jgi:hypothetical protein